MQDNNLSLPTRLQFGNRSIINIRKTPIHCAFVLHSSLMLFFSMYLLAALVVKNIRNYSGKGKQIKLKHRNIYRD